MLLDLDNFLLFQQSEMISQGETYLGGLISEMKSYE